MKRLTAAALILALCFTVLTGCGDDEEKEPDAAAVRIEILDEFNKIARIPRESGHEKAISSYLRSWAKENGFEVIRDSSNNVVITMAPSAGYENAPAVILQCNMDSKIAVSEDSTFDPVNDPLVLLDNGDTLSADGTSLGADSAAGMASILYILKHARLHGPLKAVFTTGGENGMTGAEKLDPKYLEGDFLINFGWNSDRTFGIGSAGTAYFDMTREIQWGRPQNAIPYTLSISGLNGGTAVDNIGGGGANAVKIIGEILANAQGRGILFELGSFNGGTSRDTIPDSAAVLIIINESDVKKMQDVVNDSVNAFRDAYGEVEQNHVFTYTEAQMPDKVVSFEDTGSIISFIYGILNGVQSMSESYPGVVEGASNLGLVSTATGNFLCQVSAACTTDVDLYKITTAHEAVSGMSGLEYTHYDGIPRWPDHPDSALCASILNIFSDLYGAKPSGVIVHKGLEFGWFAKKNPRLQIISIGTKIENAGLPGETLFTESVTKPVNVVMSFLEQLVRTN